MRCCCCPRAAAGRVVFALFANKYSVAGCPMYWWLVLYRSLWRIANDSLRLYILNHRPVSALCICLCAVCGVSITSNKCNSHFANSNLSNYLIPICILSERRRAATAASTARHNANTHTHIRTHIHSHTNEDTYPHALTQPHTGEKRECLFTLRHCELHSTPALLRPPHPPLSISSRLLAPPPPPPPLHSPP